MSQKGRCACLRALCLASVLFLAAAGSSLTTPFRNKFGRELLSLESTIPAYLLPTQLPPLCNGNNCCQEDDYSSAYEIVMLNSSRVESGGRTYTTFYMSLQKSADCDTATDLAGCCNSTITSVWIDIDPEVMVLTTTINSQRWANSLQDQYGFRMTLTPQQYLALPPSTLISITVLGDVKQLCPIPDMAPVPGLCSVILEGGTTSNPTACCPHGVTRRSTLGSWQPPAGVACTSDLSVSPFSMAQAFVSNLYAGEDGTQYVDYVMNLTLNTACREGPGSCCGMQLDDLQIKVLDTVQIKGVSLNSAPATFTTSEWWQAGDSLTYQVLSLSGLNLHAEDIPRAQGSWPITITVAIPRGANAVPQLCGAPEDAVAALPGTAAPAGEVGVYGACAYFLYSDDGVCCPAGETGAVEGPVMPNVCNPTEEVDIEDTSFGFMYYDYLAAATATNFTFFVSSDSSAGCAKPHCVGVCGWELAVNDAMIPLIGYASDDNENTARTTVQRGPEASIKFSFSPDSQQAQYTIRTPPGTSLSQLCRANAYPGQGSYPCAAVIRSQTVYSIVFFNQDSVVIKTYPDVCPVAQPLSASCLQPRSARFNWPDAASTVVEFTLDRADPANSNPACSNVLNQALEVILFPGPVASLIQSNQVDPRDGVTFNMTSGLEWSGTPQSANSPAQYGFKLDGVRQISQICMQNLPNQPPGTCMIQLRDAASCFNGFVSLVRDPSLVWDPKWGSSPPNRAGVIAPAVVVPIVAVIAIVLAVVIFVRRRRRSAFTGVSMAGGRDDLRAPLTGAGDSGSGLLGDRPVSPADVRLRDRVGRS